MADYGGLMVFHANHRLGMSPTDKIASMSEMMKEIRYAIRILTKNPGFSAVAVLSLALAIGANTTIFTIVNAVFLTSLPVKDIATLVDVSGIDQNNKVTNLELTPLSWQTSRITGNRTTFSPGLPISSIQA